MKNILKKYYELDEESKEILPFLYMYQELLSTKDDYENIKIVIIGILTTIIMMATNTLCFAGTGKVSVHWEGSEREATYTYAKKHCEAMGYSVENCNNWDNNQVLNQLSRDKIFIVHRHGSPGVQAFLNSTYLSGTGGNGGSIKAINSLSNGSLNNLRIAIYYGCSTGAYSNTYGDICQQTVNKGAQCSVAWTVTTYTNEVNEWNKAFLDKCKKDNIVEGYRHADYWTGVWQGSNARNRMENNRNEKGNIYGYIN